MKTNQKAKSQPKYLESPAAAAAAASVKAAYAAPEIPIANGTHSQDIPDSKTIVVSTPTD